MARQPKRRRVEYTPGSQLGKSPAAALLLGGAPTATRLMEGMPIQVGSDRLVIEKVFAARDGEVRLKVRKR